MTDLQRLPSNIPRPATPAPMSPPDPTPPPNSILVVFNQTNATYANGAMTTSEGYVTYPDIPFIYGGGLRNGLPQGYGIQKNSQTGNTYEGGWKDGRAHGYGVFYWANGDRYEGGWRGGIQNGHAELTGTLAGVPTRVEAYFRDGLRASA